MITVQIKKVLAFGTFDIFHPGHRSYLRQAKKLGDYLIVVVARDKTVSMVKRQRTVNGEQERFKIVKDSGLADEIILGNLNDKFAVIKKFRPDIIALGYDQEVDLKELKNKLKEFDLKSKIVRSKAYKPKIYKSSRLKMHRSVGAIIKKNGKILMLDRVNPPFGWACPCGHIEETEEIKDALKREVLEETGLKINDFKLVIHEFIPWNKCKEGVKGHDFFIYEVLDWEGEIEGNYESKGMRWIGKEEFENIESEETWYYFIKKCNLFR